MNNLTKVCFALIGAGLTSFAAESELPRQADLRSEFERYDLVPKNQGARDVCSLCAITGLAEFEWSRTVSPQRFSAEYLIWAACDTTGKRYEQAMFYEAIHGLCGDGLCAEALMPYQSRPDRRRRPSTEATADGQARTSWSAIWIKGWDVRSGLSSNQLSQVKRQLADGHPVSMGARWPSHEVLTPDATLETPPESEVFDGHSILFVGYQDDATQPGGGRLLFRNHRGANWADHGYAWMSYRYASLYINDAVALRAYRPAGKPIRIEAEKLKLVSNSKLQASPQEMSNWGARLWSDGTQLFCAAEAGACLETEFAVVQTNRFRLDLEATFAPDYGMIQVNVDGKELGPVFDLFSARVSPSGPMTLGTVDLGSGTHRFGVRVVGKNESSAGYSFGLDAILLTSESRK